MKTSFKERFDRWPNWRMQASQQTVFFETARDKNSFDGVHFRQSILDNRSSGTMAGKWTALAVVAALALLAIARADFHQEDTEATLTREASSRLKKEAHSPVFLNNDNSLQEQEEITDDWGAEDEDRGKGRVIKAQVAIRLKGRKRKPKNEVGDALEFGIVMNIVKVNE